MSNGKIKKNTSGKIVCYWRRAVLYSLFHIIRFLLGFKRAVQKCAVYGTIYGKYINKIKAFTMILKKKLKMTHLELYSPAFGSHYSIPFLEGKVSAGFPSSAENYSDKTLDLNELLIKHPSATFFIRVKGESMEKAGIKTNDILIVDRAVSVAHNKIVIARIADELTVKRISMIGDNLFLMPDNDGYKPIRITSEMDFEVWGVVTYVIHQV